MILKNGTVLTDDAVFRKTDLRIENGIIASLGETMEEGVDLCGAYVVPGFIDIHTHGCVGYDHLDGCAEASEEMCRYYAKCGTTSVLATIMTEEPGRMLRAAENAAHFKTENGAKISGIYLEGPFFSDAYRGAQNSNYLRDPDPAFLSEIDAASDHTLRIVSLAPERKGALDMIERGGFSFFLGHTGADYETASEAYHRGAKGLTHTFNAMTPFHHRAPGVIGAALESASFTECITDGLHVHPSAVRMLFASVGRERFVSITDSIRPAGLPDGTYESGSQAVTLSGGLARLSDGTIAGSVSTMANGVKNMVKFGIPLEDAVYVSTATPARAAGIFDKTGSITIGKSADLVVLNDDLTVQSVWIGGKKI